MNELKTERFKDRRNSVLGSNSEAERAATHAHIAAKLLDPDYLSACQDKYQSFLIARLFNDNKKIAISVLLFFMTATDDCFKSKCHLHTKVNNSFVTVACSTNRTSIKIFQFK